MLEILLLGCYLALGVVEQLFGLDGLQLAIAELLEQLGFCALLALDAQHHHLVLLAHGG